MATRDEQDALYTDLVLNDPILTALQRRHRSPWALRGTVAPEGGWLEGSEYQQLRDARLQELGIEPGQWRLQVQTNRETGALDILGIDYQNWFERHEDTIVKAGALGVFGLVGGTAIGYAAGAGGAAGGAGGAGGGAGGAAGAGMSAADWVLTVLGIGGAALNAFGQLKAGQAAKDLAELNAKYAEMQAADALTRGDEAVARLRQEVNILVGAQRAGFAGQNVVVDVGSPAQVQADARYLGEQDARQLERNAAREAWGYEAQADIYRQGGEQAVTASRFGAAGSVLGATTSLLNNRYGYGRA